MHRTVSPVTKQKLTELLEEGSEWEELDYKETLDPSNLRDLVKLAKHIGAMQLHGGYIVVGADSRGQPSGRFAPTNLKLFDEAELRRKLRKWVPEPFTLRSAVYEIEGKPFVLIRTEPSTKLWFFEETGQYPGPDGRPVELFRKGDLFVRHGSASEKAAAYDSEKIFEMFRRRESSMATDGFSAAPTDSPPTAESEPGEPQTARTAVDARRRQVFSPALDAIRHVLAGEYGVAPARVLVETRLGDDLELERPDILELIMSVEEVLALDLPEDKFLGKEFATVADLADLFASPR